MAASKFLGDLTNLRNELGLAGLAYVSPSAVALTGGTIDGVVIGANSVAAASFSTIVTTGNAQLASASIYGGSINGTSIGSVTPSSASFTSLIASSVSVNGGESHFASTSYSDPAPGNPYDVKFGGAGNGIAVRGPSLMSGSLVLGSTLSVAGTSTFNSSVNVNGSNRLYMKGSSSGVFQIFDDSNAHLESDTVMWINQLSAQPVSICAGGGQTTIGAGLAVSGTISATLSSAHVLGGLTLNSDLIVNGGVYAPQVKALFTTTGGGTITFDASGNFSWSARFIVMNAGNSPLFSTNGYFDINMPPSGAVVVGYNGAGGYTMTSTAIIPIGSWVTLYYILPIGGPNTGLTGNFALVAYGSGSFNVPANWLPLATRNGDSGKLHVLGGRYMLAPGDVMDTTQFRTGIYTPGNYGIGGSLNVTNSIFTQASVNIGNNGGNSNNKLYLSGGANGSNNSDLNHYIYSTGSGGNTMFFGEYGGIYKFYNTATNVTDITFSAGNITMSGQLTASTVSASGNLYASGALVIANLVVNGNQVYMNSGALYLANAGAATVNLGNSATGLATVLGQFQVNGTSAFNNAVAINTAAPTTPQLALNQNTTTWNTAAVFNAFRYIQTSYNGSDGFRQFAVGGGGVGIGYAPSIYGSGDALYVNGQVGIGTNAPTAMLHVAGNTIIAGNATITGQITANGINIYGPGIGSSNGLYAGTGDGASYTTYDLNMAVWWGLGITTYDGSCHGFYNARSGIWDVQGGYQINGASVIDGSRNISANTIAAVGAVSGSGDGGNGGAFIQTGGAVALNVTTNSAIARDNTNGASTNYFDVSFGGTAHGQWSWRSSNAGTQRMLLDTNGVLSVGNNIIAAGNLQSGNGSLTINSNQMYTQSGALYLQYSNTTGGVNICTNGGTTTIGGPVLASGSVTAAGNGNTAAFVQSSGNVALQMGPNASIRDLTNGASTMYFDVSLGGTANGAFIWRSNSAARVSMYLDTNANLTAYGNITAAGSLFAGNGALQISGNQMWTQSGSLYLNYNNSTGGVNINGNGGNLVVGSNMSVAGNITATSPVNYITAYGPRQYITHTGDSGARSFLGTTYQALWFGFDNPTGTGQTGLAANACNNYFAVSQSGVVGSVTNTGWSNGFPTFRNILDDGAGNMVVKGSITSTYLSIQGGGQALQVGPNIVLNSNQLYMASGDLYLGNNGSGNVQIGAAGKNTSVLGPLYANSTFYVSGNSTLIGDVGTNGILIAQGNTFVGPRAVSQQGMWMAWNQGNGDGASWIMNQKGGGGGGVFLVEKDTSNNILAYNARFYTNSAYLGGSLTIGQGGNSNAGSIYSDPNWGMYLVGLTNPAIAHFSFRGYNGTEYARIDTGGNLNVYQGNIYVQGSLGITSNQVYTNNNGTLYLNQNSTGQVSISGGGGQTVVYGSLLTVSTTMDVASRMTMYDAGGRNFYAGITTELQSQLIDFGINYSQLIGPNTSYQGGALRVDARAGQALFQFLGSRGGAAIATLDNSGNLSVNGSVYPSSQIAGNFRLYNDGNGHIETNTPLWLQYASANDVHICNGGGNIYVGSNGSSISGSGQYFCYTPGSQFCAPGYMLYSDSGSMYILLSGTTSAPSQTFNGLRPFQISLASGNVLMSNGLSVTGGLTADTITASSIKSPGTAKAWVVFDKTGKIISSYGISSVTVNATSDYTVNFNSGTFADGNYAYSCSLMTDAVGYAEVMTRYSGGQKDQNGCRFYVAFQGGGSGGACGANEMSVTFYHT